MHKIKKILIRYIELYSYIKFASILTVVFALSDIKKMATEKTKKYF